MEYKFLDVTILDSNQLSSSYFTFIKGRNGQDQAIQYYLCPKYKQVLIFLISIYLQLLCQKFKYMILDVFGAKSFSIHQLLKS